MSAKPRLTFGLDRLCRDCGGTGVLAVNSHGIARKVSAGIAALYLTGRRKRHNTDRLALCVACQGKGLVRG